MAALQPNQKGFVDCTNYSVHKLLCRMWIRNKKELAHVIYCLDTQFGPQRVQTFWLTASSVVQFPASFDVFNTLHLCYLTCLPRHCSWSVMQGCYFSNLCSVHREIGICMWIAFLLPLMWGTIACWMSTRWGRSNSFSLSCLPPLRQKTIGGTGVLLLYCCGNSVNAEKSAKGMWDWSVRMCLS